MIYVNQCIDCHTEWIGDPLLCPRCNSFNLKGTMVESVPLPPSLEHWLKQAKKAIKPNETL